MNITYTTDSPLSGTAVDTATGSPLYEINTELGSPGQCHTHSTTTIRDVRQENSVSRGVIVAVWVHAFNRDDDCVTLHGQTHPLVEWLPETTMNTPLSRCVTQFSSPSRHVRLWAVYMHARIELI